jgi:SH3-like domain-containing protein
MNLRATRFLFLVWVCASGWSGFADAAEFRSIGDRPAVMFDAPASRAARLFVMGTHQPVEVVVKLDKWSKVRDHGGDLAWVDNSFLVDKRLLVVTSAAAEVRAQPKAAAPLSFEAQRGVVLELTGPIADGFAPVRHRDGQTGFVAIAQVWGL